MRGRFITFEGGEGTGKSTQARVLAEALAASGLRVDLTREPGGTPLAERLRGLILSGALKDAGPEAEAVAFAAARADHVNRRIAPAVEAGKWVVCDRFYDSTRVYQSIAGAAEETILALQDEATGGFAPDLTIVLDIDSATAAARARARRGAEAADRFEAEGEEFHRAVRERFLELALAEPSRCAVVDAGGTADEVGARVAETVASRLGMSFGAVSPKR
jgi:thymidylate kinase